MVGLGSSLDRRTTTWSRRMNSPLATGSAELKVMGPASDRVPPEATSITQTRAMIEIFNHKSHLLLQHSDYPHLGEGKVISRGVNPASSTACRRACSETFAPCLSVTMTFPAFISSLTSVTPSR